MFTFGSALALFGYSAIYVSVYRLGGDQRTVYGILMGSNNGKPVHPVKDNGGGGGNVVTKSGVNVLKDINTGIQFTNPVTTVVNIAGKVLP